MSDSAVNMHKSSAGCDLHKQSEAKTTKTMMDVSLILEIKLDIVFFVF